MPFKSEAQRRYLWANEPEIARDWTETYGSRIQKSNGGITSWAPQGGMKNYLGEQEMVNAPKYWQSRPDKPPTELAYITDAEKDLIMQADIHGSLSPNVKGEYAPNEGPSGIISLDYQGDKGTYGQAGQSYGDRETYSSRDVTKTGGSHHPGVTGPVKTTIAPTTPKDHFTQSYVGPSILGGTGYRDTVVPNTTKYGNRSRLGSAVLSGIGLLAGIPGLGFLPSVLQSLGPFNNQAFYDQKVVPAGRTNLSYADYMKARMAGTIDAYGNPINNRGGRDGIVSVYDYNMFDDVDENTEDENITVANVPFESRFLQSQPQDVREEIESRMQNYYTV